MRVHCAESRPSRHYIHFRSFGNSRSAFVLDGNDDANKSELHLLISGATQHSFCVHSGASSLDPSYQHISTSFLLRPIWKSKNSFFEDFHRSIAYKLSTKSTVLARLLGGGTHPQRPLARDSTDVRHSCSVHKYCTYNGAL